jgi:hypothetical protein
MSKSKINPALALLAKSFTSDDASRTALQYVLLECIEPKSFQAVATDGHKIARIVVTEDDIKQFMTQINPSCDFTLLDSAEVGTALLIPASIKVGFKIVVNGSGVDQIQYPNYKKVIPDITWGHKDSMFNEKSPKMFHGETLTICQKMKKAINTEFTYNVAGELSLAMWVGNDNSLVFVGIMPLITPN